MPIRFRCAYCNQLMGIARRKAGAIVRCPTCAGQVVVPDPRAASGSSKPEKPGVFERKDFGKVFQDPAAAGGPSSGPPSRGARLDVEAVPLPDLATSPRGMYLSSGKVVLLSIVLFLLVGLSFVAGFVLARFL